MSIYGWPHKTGVIPVKAAHVKEGEGYSKDGQGEEEQAELFQIIHEQGREERAKSNKMVEDDQGRGKSDAIRSIAGLWT